MNFIKRSRFSTKVVKLDLESILAPKSFGRKSMGKSVDLSNRLDISDAGFLYAN